MSPTAGAARRAGALVHAVCGTRGLTPAVALVLLMVLLEPFLPTGFPRALYAVPLGALLLLGLATLPREGVAANRRAVSLLDEPDAVRRMRRRSAWGAALGFALLPNVFLAVQGIPHMSPLAGLATQEVVRMTGLVGLFAVLLLAVLYLRSSRGYAPGIVPQLPRELRAESRAHTQREVLMVLMWILVVAWVWMLQSFWRPFTLLEWHGLDLAAYFGSFQVGARGLAGVSFAVVPPVLLFFVLASHLSLLWELHRRRAWREKAGVASFAFLHAGLAVLGVLLHAYNLFWIARFRSLGFL